jgi:hypothetical protein
MRFLKPGQWRRAVPALHPGMIKYFNQGFQSTDPIAEQMPRHRPRFLLLNPMRRHRRPDRYNSRHE